MLYLMIYIMIYMPWGNWIKIKIFNFCYFGEIIKKVINQCLLPNSCNYATERANNPGLNGQWKVSQTGERQL